jgi:methionyl-tRNA formyltransferase
MLTNIVLFFNGDRGVSALKALLRSEHDVVAIVTSPKMSDKLNFEIRTKKKFVHLKIFDVNSPESIDTLKLLKPTLFIIAGFSSIFGPDLLAVPPLGTLNLHAGKLPQYRGGSPLNWQLINGEKNAGISIIQADSGIDTGAILVEAKIPIGTKTNIADLHAHANELFPELLLQALCRLEKGEVGRKQSEGNAQYWHQRNDDDGRVYLREMTANQVDLMIRALSRPYPGAWCLYKNKVLRLFSANVPDIFLRGVPGRVCFIRGIGPYIICFDRGILVNDYSIEGSNDQRLRHGDQLQ